MARGMLRTCIRQEGCWQVRHLNAALPLSLTTLIWMDYLLRPTNQNLKFVCLTREGLCNFSNVEVRARRRAGDSVKPTGRSLYSAGAVSRGLSAASPVSN